MILIVLYIFISKISAQTVCATKKWLHNKSIQQQQREITQLTNTFLIPFGKLTIN